MIITSFIYIFVQNKKTYLLKKIYFIAILVLLFKTTYAQVPNANFSANVTTGCAPLLVTFHDLSTGGATGWYWTFGDGSSSSVQNPTHPYTMPGTYTVTLVAINASGNSTPLAKPAFITVFQVPSVAFTATPTAGCAPVNVCFTNTSTPGSAPITTYAWNFGDGGQSTAQNPCHIYALSGLWPVTLTVTDGNTCTKTLTQNNFINVSAKPNANFTFVSPTPCNLPINVAFTNTSSPPGNTYSWYWGDATAPLLTTTNATPTHGYNASGNFTVTLIVNPAGCADTQTHVVNITSNVFTANFSAPTTSGCVPFTANFTNTSGPNATSWSWNFGDGSPLNTTQNPSHPYTTPGVYTVTLIATNPRGCSDTIIRTNYITAFSLPNVTFTSTPTPFLACIPPVSVPFSCNVPGATAWNWSFGDGNDTTVQNPVHTYTTTGIFSVTLSVTDNHGCVGTLVQSNYITISPPNTEFSMSPNNGCAPLTVNFTDLTTTISSIINRIWNFGDGTPTSNLTNPTHIYADTGVFVVSLNALDASGCFTIHHDTVRVGRKPVANFIADDTIGCHKFLVNFTDLSSSYANEWSWDFGGNGNSDLQDPQHIFTDTGYFDVQLIVSHNGCADTLKKENYIYVKPPKPLFSATPLQNCTVPLSVHFTDESILATSWKWYFGDGDSSTVQNPTHIYNNEAFDTVTLIVTNPNGCRDTLTKFDYIKISHIVPDFIQGNNTICQHGTIAFMSTSTANTSLASWSWNFGDGTTGTGFGINHVFDSVGTFSIKLAVVDGLGCHDSITKPSLITVYPVPSPRFTANITQGCAPLTVNFTNTSFAIAPATLTGYAWNFGDGTSTLANPPPHTYMLPGVYTVSLTVTDSRGCDSTKTRYFYITVTKPVANFSCDSIVCNGDAVSFSNLSTGGNITYHWNFGDGSPTSSLPNPTHTYNVPSTIVKYVTLTVTDSNGCSDTLSKPIRISRPVPNFTSNIITANCPPSVVNFTSTSSADVVSWYWSFGEAGSNSSNHSGMQDPQHIYNASGLYNVQLTVVNTDGCTDSITKPGFIHIYGPTGTFVFTPLSGCAPLHVNFTATTQSTDTYLWLFGDAGTATTQNPSYIYNTGGVFLPEVILTDTAHDCSLTVPALDSVHVIIGYPDFTFTGFGGTCKDTTTVHFTDISVATGPITSWLWNFGDGTPTSNLQNPSHFYSTDGSYDVTLTITIGPCTYSYTHTNLVTVPPVVQIEILNPCSMDVVFHVVNLADSVITWDWDFGDGGAHGTVRNPPPHTYLTPGPRIVVLTVTFASGCTYSYTQTFQVYPTPIAGFTADKNNVVAGTDITFTDQSIGTDLAWSWNFGEGPGSNVQNPIYAYEQAGTFLVILTVTTPNNCIDTASLTLTIKDDVIVPNVFTPNGDGHNDNFNIISLGFPDYTLLVFNRWGKTIFTSTSPTELWDGTVAGKLSPEGTYFWVLRVKNQVKEKELSGTVTLIR